MTVPETIARVLARVGSLSREDKMAALLSYANKLEPVPDQVMAVADDSHVVHECQTPVRIFWEFRDNRLHFYADINRRQSPTVAAFLSLVFSAVNHEPPATTLAIPTDFVRTAMAGLGLGTREVGLEALVARLKRHAAEAARASST
jgi:cysteine desulfuration protein SufE